MARPALAGAALAVAALLGAAPLPAPHAPPAADAPATDLTRQDLVMAASGCGVERWAVKTGSDAQRGLVSTSQHPTTIAALRGLRAPSALPAGSRLRPTETTEYVVAGTLTGYKVEGDGDYHLVLTDSAGRTLIVELADPRCAATSRFKTEIANVRRVFDARYTPTGSMRDPRRAIRVRGIGFFDYRHGQTGVAPNGIELHPVLGLGFP